MFVTVEKDVHILCKTLILVQVVRLFSSFTDILNHQMYQYQLNVLPEHGFRCIAMDIRGMDNLISHGLVTRMID